MVGAGGGDARPGDRQSDVPLAARFYFPLLGPPAPRGSSCRAWLEAFEKDARDVCAGASSRPMDTP